MTQRVTQRQMPQTLPRILKIDFNNGTGTRSSTGTTGGAAIPGAAGDTSYTAPVNQDVDILFTITLMINPSAGGVCQAYLSINGTNYGPGMYMEPVGTAWKVQTISQKYALNAGQTITIGARWSMSSGTATITNATGDASFPNEITGLVIARPTA